MTKKSENGKSGNQRSALFMKITVTQIIKLGAVFGSLYALTFAVFYGAAQYPFEPLKSFNAVRLVIFILLLPILVKYFIQLILLPFYRVVYPRKMATPIKQNWPSVSVLIPAWNEEVGILKTIQSVLKNKYPNLQIIIIDDGSTDSTHRIVTQFLSSYQAKNTNSPKLDYLSLQNGGKAKALNRGLELATGEIVVTIDADSVMDSHALENMVMGFDHDKVAAVAGNVVIGNRKKSLELIQQLEYLYGFFFKRADSVFDAVYIIGGAAAAYRKDVLLQLGGFDEKIITEDIEMSTRILANGFKTRYAADAIVYTEGPSDWKGLCKQRLRWKHGRILTFFKHRNLFFSLDKSHNPYLTCMLLPMAVYAEFLLLCEGVLLSVFYGYTLLTFDFLPLIFVILFISSLVAIQVMIHAKSRFHMNLLLLAPIAWLIFYIIDVVEFQALIRSLKRLMKKQELHWQKWTRVGLLSATGVQDAAIEPKTHSKVAELSR